MARVAFVAMINSSAACFLSALGPSVPMKIFMVCCFAVISLWAWLWCYVLENAQNTERNEADGTLPRAD